MDEPLKAAGAEENRDVMRKDGKQKRNPLTQAEKQEIIRLRVEGRHSSCEIAKMMDSNFTTICALIKPFPLTADEMRARKSRISKKMRQKRADLGQIIGGAVWTDQEDEFLRKSWPAKNKARVMAGLPGRAWHSITKRASDKGITRSPSASSKRNKRIDPFFKELRGIREARGITRENLSERIGIHRIHLAKYENGDLNPRWAMLRAWLQALEYEIHAVPVRAVEISRGKRPWLEEEEEILRELAFQGSTPQEMALSLKRSSREIELKCKTLGLHESEATRGVSGMTRARLS